MQRDGMCMPAHAPCCKTLAVAGHPAVVILLPCSSALCSSPAVTGEAKGPQTATITISPPPGGPWGTYSLSLCPVGGSEDACINITCKPTSLTSPSCPASNLIASTTYVVQASLRRAGVLCA